MKSIISVLLTVFLGCISCLSAEKNGSLPENEVRKKTNNSLLLEKTSRVIDTLRLTNDEFIIRILENDLLLSRVLNVYNPVNVQSQMLQNKIDQSKTDTLVTLARSSDVFKFLKADGKTLPLEAHIETNFLIFDTDIRVGVSKSVFEQKFNISSIFDLLIIEDTEGGNSLSFLFESNKLSRISYKVSELD